MLCGQPTSVGVASEQADTEDFLYCGSQNRRDNLDATFSSSLGAKGSSIIFAVRESAAGVRRGKAALSSGCKSHPANAPAGSNRGSHGDNEMAEASDSVSRNTGTARPG